jgi:hypothetical protein
VLSGNVTGTHLMLDGGRSGSGGAPAVAEPILPRGASKPNAVLPWPWAGAGLLVKQLRGVLEVLGSDIGFRIGKAHAATL